MMLTRCPGCATTFRVTPEQVKVRHGQVRCGRCQHVFDAIEFLVEASLAAEAPQAQTVVKTTPQAVIETPVAASTALEEVSPEVVETPASIAVSNLGEEAPTEPIIEDARSDVARADTAEVDNILLQPSPLSSAYAQADNTRSAPRWPWLIAATFAFVALIAQVAISFRADLAVKYPDLRPALEMLCEQASCSIELPSNPELVSIEGSDLHPGRKGGLELTATLRNRAPHAQAWPYLELTLTDGADKPMVRRVIEPAQYLPVTQSAADGFAANGELAVQLALDAGNLPAAGYRLYLFYP